MDSELLVIRTSERKSFTRCRQQWQWAYRDCLTPKEVKPALRFGDLIHQALAGYYIPSKTRTRIVRGPHPVKLFEQLYKKQLEEFASFGMYTAEGEWEDALDLGREMLTNYIDLYGKDEQYRVVKPEADFQVDLWTQDDEYICTYVGTFDAVVEDLNTGKYGLFEHKTAKSIKTAHLVLDEQAGSYWAFAPMLIEEKLLGKMDFVLYNFLRKGKLDDRPQDEAGRYLNKPTKEVLQLECQAIGLDLPKSAKVDDLIAELEYHNVDPLQLGEVSKTQPAPLFDRQIVRRTQKERINTLKRIDQQAEEIAWIDEGAMKVYKNPTQDCSWQCDFFDMCCLHEAGQDWEGYRDVAMVRWDPYQAHNDHMEDIDAG